MPWRCPACSIQIRHSEAELSPRPGALYRCYVCRLELVLDPETNKLAVAPMHPDADDHPGPRDR